MRRLVPLLAPLFALSLAGAAPWTPAHDDGKAEEMGDGLPGTGVTGELLVPDSSGRIMDFSARRVALLSWLTSEDLAGRVQTANDVWGYVAPSGREYAIVGLFEGTAFVEVTDPLNPEVVAMIPGAASAWRDMAVYDRYAYSVNESGDGLQVIDLRRIDRGRVRLVRNFQDGGLATAHNISINPQSGYAYLSGSNLDGGGLLMIDLSDPRRPRLEPGGWSSNYVHDALVVTYDRGRFAGREVAFAFAGFSGLQILDVTDKDAVELLSEMRYPGLAYCHSGWLHGNRRYLYLNDELDERSVGGADETRLHVLRVGNLERPRYARRLSFGLTSVDHNNMVRGKRLFQANYTSGLRVLSLERPGRPRESGYFDTHPEDDEPVFRGAWGVYAGLPSGAVLISDIQRGLFVLAP